jgi:hypothetical protein
MFASPPTKGTIRTPMRRARRNLVR